MTKFFWHQPTDFTVQSVAEDGNCLFSALDLLVRNEEITDGRSVRMAICEFYSSCREQALADYVGRDLNQYATFMEDRTDIITDIEIVAAATLFQMDIYIARWLPDVGFRIYAYSR